MEYNDIKKDNIKNHLKALIQLSIVDYDFGELEKMHVYAIAKANKVTEKEIDQIVNKVLQSKEQESINYDGLMAEERFSYLYDIVQLMKIDGKVFLSEIKYCEDIAERLGYDRKVVRHMASKIYSNPSITSDRERLMRDANKYLIAD